MSFSYDCELGAKALEEEDVEDCNVLLGSCGQSLLKNDGNDEVTQSSCLTPWISRTEKRHCEEAPDQQCDALSSSSSSSLAVYGSSIVDQEKGVRTGTQEETQEQPSRKKRRTEEVDEVVSDGPQSIDDDFHKYDTLDGVTAIEETAEVKVAVEAMAMESEERGEALPPRGDLDRIFGERCLTQGDIFMEPSEGVMASWYIARIPNKCFE
jgi:hypothetical protein